jgi:hypothetical protein
MGFHGVDDPVAFWLTFQSEHQGIVRLATFLLSAPVQISSCERAFAMPTYLKKTPRSLAGRERLLQTEQIKHAQHWKNQCPFPSDFRVKSAQELPLISSDNRGSSEEIATHQVDEATEDEEATAKEADVVQAIRRALGAITSSDHDDRDIILEVTVGEPPGMSGTSLDEVEREVVEDLPEVQPNPLAELPCDSELESPNNSDLPQENLAYFQSKTYLRNDKISLKTLQKLANVKPGENGTADPPTIGFPDLNSLYGHAKAKAFSRGRF